MGTSSKNLNALKHGMHARDIVLPWEDSEEFEDLLQGLRAYTQPQGEPEADVVFDIALNFWRKRRLWRVEQLRFVTHPQAVEMAQAGLTDWEGVQQYIEQRVASDATFRDIIVTIVGKLTQEMQDKWAKRDDVDLKEPESTRASFEKLYNSQKSYRALVESLIAKSLRAEVLEGPIRLADLERDLKLHAQLDARIEKGFARLAGMKEFRKIYGDLAPEPPPRSNPRNTPGDLRPKRIARAVSKKDK